MDTETEVRVREALSRMVKGRTSVIIAHRLSTIQQADKIMVMHKGHLREMGTIRNCLRSAASTTSFISCNTKIKNSAVCPPFPRRCCRKSARTISHVR